MQNLSEEQFDIFWNMLGEAWAEKIRQLTQNSTQFPLTIKSMIKSDIKRVTETL